MLEQTRKANEANAPHRQRIIEVKRKLRAQIQDMPRRFAAMTARVEAQIEQIVRERASGTMPVPQVEFGQLDRVTEAQKDHIRQRGCLVIRNVFDDARVDAWTADLSKYLETNDYLEKLKKGGAVDNYFSTLASAKPQIYGVLLVTGADGGADRSCDGKSAGLPERTLARIVAERSGLRSRSESHLRGPRPLPPTR